MPQLLGADLGRLQRFSRCDRQRTAYGSSALFDGRLVAARRCKSVHPTELCRLTATLSVRERLAEHRGNPACARCHDLIDPVGLSLENFGAVGRWRDFENGLPVDASAGLPDGSQFTGIVGLEQGLLNRPEIFVGTMAEKLLTYALGRGVGHHDAPAIRQIVRESQADGFRFSSLMLAIVKSTPFHMRTSQ